MASKSKRKKGKKQTPKAASDQLDNIKKTLFEKENELEIIKKKNKEKTEEFNKIIKNLKKEIENRNKTIKNLEKEENKKEINKLQANLKVFQKNIEKKDSKISSLTNEKKDIQKELEELEKLHEAETSKFTQNIESMQKELELHKSQDSIDDVYLFDSSSKLSELKSRIKELKIEIKGYKNHSDSLRKTIQGINQESEKQKQVYLDKIQKLNKEVKPLKQKIKDLNEKFDIQTAAFSEKLIVNLKSNMFEINDTIWDLRSEIKNKADENKLLNEKISELKDTNAKLSIKEQKLLSLESKLGKLDEIMKDSDKKQKIITNLQLEIANSGVAKLKLEQAQKNMEELKELAMKQEETILTLQQSNKQSNISDDTLSPIDFEQLPFFAIKMTDSIKDLKTEDVPKEFRSTIPVASKSKIEKSGPLGPLKIKDISLKPLNIPNVPGQAGAFPNIEKVKKLSKPKKLRKLSKPVKMSSAKPILKMSKAKPLVKFSSRPPIKLPPAKPVKKENLERIKKVNQKERKGEKRRKNHKFIIRDFISFSRNLFVAHIDTRESTFIGTLISSPNSLKTKPPAS